MVNRMSPSRSRSVRHLCAVFALGAGLLLPALCAAQAAQTVVVTTVTESPLAAEVPLRPWFVSASIGLGYNRFALDASSGAQSYSALGPSFVFQGGLRFRRFTLHATLLANIALDPGLSGRTSNRGVQPAQNLMHFLIGPGATLFIPKTPLYAGVSLGLGGLVMNFASDRDSSGGGGSTGASEGPNSLANVGFAGSIHLGASFRVADTADVFVELNGLFGSYRAGDTAPAELNLRGETGTWTSMSWSLQVGGRF